MRELTSLLQGYFAANGCEASVWTGAREEGQLVAEASAPPGAKPPDPLILPLDDRFVSEVTGEHRILACIPGPRRAWLAVGPCSEEASRLDQHVRFLLPVVTQFMQSAMEVEHAANELAERYEEINLLYTISEILGRTVRLEEAAATILTEISETVGARRASILVHDRVTDTLQVAAVRGGDIEDAPPIAVDDESSVSALVFRTQHPRLVEDGEMPCEAEASYRRGSMLSVPIMWTTAEGGEPLGVVNLSGRRSRQPFTAGDQKLVAAIATQIGTAIQNARLVRSSLNQQRLAHEMQLAHDLQMRLLPSVAAVAGDATVAAKVVPADSVGGDFYNLFPLADSCVGMMVGDVSGHGYRAALIMALTMSASAIHAQTVADPGAALEALRESLHDELTTTEMFISVFYGVVDRKRGVLRYANAGHPHAFVFNAAGEATRLPALDPPLGMTDDAPSTATRTWSVDDELLLLFTDGLSDARNRAGERLGEEEILEIVAAGMNDGPQVIVNRILELVEKHSGRAVRDDVTLLVMRS